MFLVPHQTFLSFLSSLLTVVCVLFFTTEAHLKKNLVLTMVSKFTCSLLLLIFMSIFTAAPSQTVISMADRYEVRDGILKLAHRVDDNGTQWTQKVSLERLEVLANDRALNLPFASCTEEKFTRQNKYADHLGQDSKFEEIHKVPLRFYLLIKRKRHRFTGIFGVGEGEKGEVGKGEGEEVKGDGGRGGERGLWEVQGIKWES